MEAIKFMKELKRYCDNTSCKNCEAMFIGCNTCLEDVDIVEGIEFIEKWSIDNPAKTRQSEFLKLYPDATLDSNCNLIITPCSINKELYNKSCEKCKYMGYSSCNKAKYWNEEIE